MSAAQWLFHYLEIKKYNNTDKSLFLQSLADIETSIQAFYLLIDKDRGATLMDTLADIRKSRDDDSDDNNEEAKQTKLTDTDEELLAFAESLPKEIALPNEFKNTGKFILPTRKLSDIIGNDVIYEEVDSINDIHSTQSGEEQDTKNIGDIGNIEILEVDSIEDIDTDLG